MALVGHRGKIGNRSIMYRAEKYYGKLNIMVEQDKENGNIMGDMLTVDEVSEIVQCIQDDDQDGLDVLLNKLSGRNISDILVTATLPKRWHHIAKTVKSTPLRTAISWRNIKALDLILQSKCIVSKCDISQGLQKILRHVESTSSTEVEIVRRLVANGAETETPASFTLAFEKLVQAKKVELCEEVVSVICQSCTSNSLAGMLLLSISKHSARNQQECRSRDIPNNWEDAWRDFSRRSMKTVIENTAFSPRDFIADTKVWLSLGSTPFQYLVHAFPLLIQISTSCQVEALGWLLRHVSRYYGHTCTEGKSKIRQLPRLMWAAGINLPQVMSVACLSPRFMQDTGFSTWTQHHKSTVKTLQHSCRTIIRNNITTGNVHRAMIHMNSIPTPMKEFILLKNVQLLPWDKE